MADCITPPATGPPSCQHLPSNLMISPNRGHVNASASIGMQGPFGNSYGPAMGGCNVRFPNAAGNLPVSAAGLTHGGVGDIANPHKPGGSQPVYVFPTSTANSAAEAITSGKCKSLLDYHEREFSARSSPPASSNSASANNANLQRSQSNAMIGISGGGPRQQCPDAALNVSASTSSSMLPSTAKAGLDVRTDVVAAGRSSLGARYSSSSPAGGGGPGSAGNPQVSKAKTPLSVPPQQLHAPTPPGGPMSVPAKIEHPSSSDHPSPLAFNDPRTPRNPDSPAKPASLAASHHRSSTPAYASTSSMLGDQLHPQHPAGAPSTTQSHVGTSSNGPPGQFLQLGSANRHNQPPTIAGRSASLSSFIDSPTNSCGLPLSASSAALTGHNPIMAMEQMANDVESFGPSLPKQSRLVEPSMSCFVDQQQQPSSGQFASAIATSEQEKKMQKLRQVESLLKTSAPETSDIPGIPGGPPPMMPQQVNGHLTGGPPMMHAGPMGYPQRPMMPQMMPQRMPMPPMRNPETGMIMPSEEQQHWINFQQQQQQRRQDEQQRAAAAAQFHQQQRMPMHPNMGYIMSQRGPMIRSGGEMMHPAMMRAVAPPPPQQVVPPATTTKGKKRKNNQAPPPPPQPQLMQMAPPPHQMRMMGPVMYDEYSGPMMGHPMAGPPRPMIPPMHPQQQHEMMMMQQHGQQHVMQPMQQRPHMPSHMQMAPAPPPMGPMYANGPPAAAPMPNPQQANDIFSGTSDDDLAVLNDLYNSAAGDDIFSNIDPFLYEKLPPSVSAQTSIASQTATAASNTPKYAQFHQQGAKAMVAVGGPMQIDLQHQQPDCRNSKMSQYSSNNKQQVPPGGRPGAESNNSNTFIYTQMSIQQLNIQNVNGQSFGGNIQQMNMNSHQHQQQFVNIPPGGQGGPMPPNFGAHPHAPRPPPPEYANAANRMVGQAPPPNAQMRMDPNFCPPGSQGAAGAGFVEPITNVEAKVPSANISYRPQAPQQNQAPPPAPPPQQRGAAGFGTMPQGVNVQPRVATAADMFGFDVVDELNGSLCGQGQGQDYAEMIHQQRLSTATSSSHMRGPPGAAAGPPPPWAPGGAGGGDFGSQNFTDATSFDYQQFTSVRSRTGAS